MDVTEQYSDVLFNIESRIFTHYLASETLSDSDTLKVLAQLTRYYNGLRKGRTPSEPKVSDALTPLLNSVKSICDVHCMPEETEPQAPRQVSFDVMVACLRRIERSVKMWKQQGGRRGYFEYMTPFMRPGLDT